MQPIGCRAYALNTELKNADKLESRALIGHLVGYVGTNIFRIWLPATSVRHGGNSLASLLTPSLLGLHGAPPELTELLSFYPTLTLIVLGVG